MNAPNTLCSLLAAACLFGCGSKNEAATDADASFHWVAHTNAALMSVHGTAADDVWLSGADDGSGPLVLHWDGASWQRLQTGARGDLWWVHALAAGPVFFGGSNGLVLRYEGGAFEVLDTPDIEQSTVFGVWAAAADNVYVAGSVLGKNGFLWRYDGTGFDELALPEGLPIDADGNAPGLLKVWGTTADDVWAVGGSGVVLRGNAEAGFALARAEGNATLFTVHAAGERLAIVGGSSSGVILESGPEGLVDATPPEAPLLQGVNVTASGSVWAVGYAGTIYENAGHGYLPVDSGLDFRAAESLHAVWVDPKGGVWAAGGDVLTPNLDQGLALHRGDPVSEFAEP